MNAARQYSTPSALRAAIADRLKAVSAQDSSRSLQDLMRQFAYDRLLYRVFTSEEADRWVLKGATALLARLRGEARHSIDIDLFDKAGSLEGAEQSLQVAAEREVGDFFRFALAPGRRIADSGAALRLSATAYLGVSEFARFNVDLVVATGMTGTPDEAGPLVPVEIPGLANAAYRVYPLADHVADKVFAIIELHTGRDGRVIASTRYRDLADLVLVARREVVEARRLEIALGAQAQRRHVDQPPELRPPADAGWRAGYARVAKDMLHLEEKDYETAVKTAKRLIDPVLQGTARGRWNPDRQIWSDE